MARKFTLSPTKLKTYFTCPMMYRLEYVEKLGKFYHRARAGYSFGHSLHRALDAFHHAGGTEAVSAEELTTSLEAVWVKQGYKGEEQETAFREEGLRILQDYHAVQVAARAEAPPDAPPPPHLLFTEKTLRADLTKEIALSGRVDRIDEHHDGTLEIVDYKSGRTTVEEEDVSGSLALNIYQVLLKRLYPDRRVFATLVALRTGASASYELPIEQHDDLFAEWQETGELLRNKDWESTLPVLNEHCPYCDFLPHCERYWRLQKLRGADT